MHNAAITIKEITNDVLNFLISEFISIQYFLLNTIVFGFK
jgi:hypothetical protein